MNTLAVRTDIYTVLLEIIECPAVKSENDTRLRPTSAKRNYARIVTRTNRRFIGRGPEVKTLAATVFVFLFLAVLAPQGTAETLWTPGFAGYLSRGTTLNPGDTVMVELGTGFSLSFQSASQESKSLTLEFSGGEFGDLFSFLPAARSGGDRSVSGDSGWEISGRLAAQVVAVDATGLATVTGSRSISFDGKTDTVALSGAFQVSEMNMDRAVPFDSLVNSTLAFTTTVEPGRDLLTAADIQQIVEASTVETVTVDDATAATPVADSALPAPSSAAASTRYELPLDRRRQLFVDYLNRIVDILFTQP